MNLLIVAGWGLALGVGMVIPIVAAVMVADALGDWLYARRTASTATAARGGRHHADVDADAGLDWSTRPPLPSREPPLRPAVLRDATTATWSTTPPLAAGDPDRTQPLHVVPEDHAEADPVGAALTDWEHLFEGGPR